MQQLKAFTLVEIIIVVTLMGIMAAFAIPNFTKSVTSAYVKDAKTNLNVIYAAQRIYFNTNGSYYGGNGTSTATINTNLSLGIVASGGTTYLCPNGGATFCCSGTVNGNGAVYVVKDSASTPVVGTCP